MTAVAVVGMHRSGTSMVMRALMAAGLRGGEEGDLIRPAPDNPEGFWEHDAIKRVNERVLTALGGAWDCPPPRDPGWSSDPTLASLKARAAEILADLQADAAWGWKDPRTALNFEFWHELVPDLRLVACVRNPIEVALSLRERHRTSLEFGLRLWWEYNQRILQLEDLAPAIWVHYDSMLHNTRAHVLRLASFIGLDTSPSAVDAAVESCRRPLRHAEIRDEELKEFDLAASVLDLYRRLSSASGRDTSALPSAPGTQGHRVGRVDQARVELAVARRVVQQQRSEIAQRSPTELATGELAAVQEQLQVVRADVSSMTDAIAALQDQVHASRYELERIMDPVGWHDVAAVRRLVRDRLPIDARVAVITKGDARLVDIYGRAAFHHPAAPDGSWLGFHPPSDDAAIAQLEATRARGADHLLIPKSSLWWLDHYGGLAAYLEQFDELSRDESAWLFALVPASSSVPAEHVAASLTVITFGHRGESRVKQQLREAGIDARVIAVPTDAGPCYEHATSSIGLAMRSVTTEFTLVMSPHAVSVRGSLAELIDALADSGVAAASPRVLGADGYLQNAGMRVLPEGCLEPVLTDDDDPSGCSLTEREVIDAAWAGCVLFRAADVTSVGSLEGSDDLQTATADLCARLQRRGRRVILAPAAVVVNCAAVGSVRMRTAR